MNTRKVLMISIVVTLVAITMLCAPLAGIVWDIWRDFHD